MEKGPGLEVDSRQNGLYSRSDGTNPKYSAIEPDSAGSDGHATGNGLYASQNTTGEPQRKILGLRRTTFTLSLLLAIVLILGIVSAVGAGTCASKNGGFTGPGSHSLNADTPQQQEQQQTTCPSAAPTASSAPPNTSGSTNGNISTILPTTSCPTLGTRYSSKLSKKEQFTLYCGTDFVGNNFIGLFAYRFEDCIEACASFNEYELFGQPCTHLTYTTNVTAFPESAGQGNCFLKNGTGNGSGQSVGSSAVLVTASS